jgi:hypothetical protein
MWMGVNDVLMIGWSGAKSSIRDRAGDDTTFCAAEVLCEGGADFFSRGVWCSVCGYGLLCPNGRLMCMILMRSVLRAFYGEAKVWVAAFEDTNFSFSLRLLMSKRTGLTDATVKNYWLPV